MSKIKNAILLAGGSGTRLRPFTNWTNKSLLNVNGKPIIDYPINTLVKMGIENLTISVGTAFAGQIIDYVKDGSQYGLNVNYRYQQYPLGIAYAINQCKQDVFNERQWAVILGDNLFENDIVWNKDYKDSGQVILHKHKEIERFGVASIDPKTHWIEKIEEKPKALDCRYENYAITGCYLFNEFFFDYFAKIKPSARGEFEITDILLHYLADDKLHYNLVDGLWSDLGTHDAIASINHYFSKALYGNSQEH